MIEVPVRQRRFRLPSACCGALLAATLLSGCGGSGFTVKSRVVYGPDAVQVNPLTGEISPVRLGRGFVKLDEVSGEALEIGFELHDDAVPALPSPPYNVPLVFAAPLPAEAAAKTPFQFIGFSNWAAHDPVNIGDVPHFHAVFLRQPTQIPSPGLVKELAPVAANEVAPGFIDGRDIPTAVVPGVGNGFEDPTFPHMLPGWYNLTYNYFYYDGHLNGIGTGVTHNFLKDKQSSSMVIARPEVYPAPGVYPGRVSVHHDAARKVFVFSLSELSPAQRTVSP